MHICRLQIDRWVERDQFVRHTISFSHFTTEVKIETLKIILIIYLYSFIYSLTSIEIY